MKEALLSRLSEMTKEMYGFKWENSFRLAKSELEFLLSVFSKAYVQERALLKACNNNPDDVAKMIDRVVKDENLTVVEMHGG